MCVGVWPVRPAGGWQHQVQHDGCNAGAVVLAVATRVSAAWRRAAAAATPARRRNSLIACTCPMTVRTPCPDYTFTVCLTHGAAAAAADAARTPQRLMLACRAAALEALGARVVVLEQRHCFGLIMHVITIYL